LTQETADAPAEIADPPAQPTPSAKPQKKVNHPARANEKPQAKGERETSRAATRAKLSQPAMQKQAADAISQKAVDAASALVPPSPADHPLNNESRNESLVATAATPWPVVRNTEDASASGTTGVDATEAAKANAVQLVDPNEVNDLDRAAAATVPANSSWRTYLLLILSAALVAASTIWFFAIMRFLVRRWQHA
jgi:hypothetical protein